MTDLVQQLRELGKVGPRPNIIEQAADRIERLEAALREIASCPMNCSGVASYALNDTKDT